MASAFAGPSVDSVINNKFESNYCRLPGTGWAMVAPEGFLPNRAGHGFHSTDRKNFIYVKETNFDQQKLIRQCSTHVIKPKHYIINGFNSYYFDKEDNECFSSYAMLIIVDGERQIEVVLMEDNNNVKTMAEMKKSAFSFIIDSTYKYSAQQTLDFDLDFSGSKLQTVEVLPFERVSFESNDFDSSVLEVFLRPDELVCPKSIKEYKKEKPAGLVLQNLKFAKIKIDNLTAYEFQGIQRNDFTVKYFYKLFIDGKEISYNMEAYSKNYEHILILQKVARSFKQKQKLCN